MILLQGREGGGGQPVKGVPFLRAYEENPQEMDATDASHPVGLYQGLFLLKSLPPGELGEGPNWRSMHAYASEEGPQLDSLRRDTARNSVCAFYNSKCLSVK